MNNHPRLFTESEILDILFLSPNAMAIYTTGDIIIQNANQAMLGFWGRDKSIFGLPLEVGVPELKDQAFITILKDVWHTGITYEATDTAADILLGGQLQTFYYDFTYRAIKNGAGEIYCILHTATDVTERNLNRIALARARQTENALEREQAVNEELAAANEELAASNEQLHITQQKLFNLNNELEDRVERRTTALAESEGNFRNMIMQAPLAMGLFTGPEMCLAMINDKFLELWQRDRSIMGKPLITALPELVDQPFLKIMQGVYTSGEPYHGTESEVHLERNGELEKGYYNFINHPFRNDLGVITGIIVVAHEVTDQVIARQKIEDSEANLRSLVMSAHYSLMILRGREWIIEVANQPLVDLWDKTIEQVTGRPLMEILPEIEDQPFPNYLRQVFDTGEAYGQEEEVFYYNSPTGPVKKYVSYYYDPMFNSRGEVIAIIVVNARHLLEQSYAEQQDLNEELAALNEELAITNNELAQTQESLQAYIDELAQSEARFRFLVQQAPVAIGVLDGRELVIESANEMMLKIWGKTTDVICKTLAAGLPELKGQPFLQILDDVYTSGQPYFGTEAKASIEYNGELEEHYFNFIYQPLKNETGATTSIMVVANDVTEQVLNREDLQKAEEMLRFSIDAANVGTWFLNIDTHEFVVSPRLKELIGYHADEDVPFDAVAAQIPEDYREGILQAVQKAVSTGDNYVTEHPVIGFHDGKKRWVRALGRLYPDATGKLSHFSGLMIDITEQKQDDLRKNDFIGMVSHELKTPLTSMSAYVQLLYSKAQRSEDTFTTGVLEKANIQVKKMSNLINGFLNVSRLESSKIYLDKQDFDLGELAREMIEDTALTVASHEVIFVPCLSVMVNADRDKIGSVISNLLSNAVKYSHKKSRIEVKCDVTGSMARISVKDEGIGIKPHDAERLFERYYRVESTNTQNISGFGIGLYLSAEIIHRHDGKIGVESEFGAGSTFWFTIPLV